MAQYIDKDVLVAEIERLKADVLQKKEQCKRKGLEKIMHQIGVYNKVLSLINTLEVKGDNLLTEEKTEKELAESYINLFDKKFRNKLPNLKSKQLAEFKNFINTCEQTFYMKYFDYHATQGKLFEKLALLWAVWGKEHLSLEVKEVDLEKEMDRFYGTYRKNGITYDVSDNEACFDWKEDKLAEHEMRLAKHFFELGLKTKGE